MVVDTITYAKKFEEAPEKIQNLIRLESTTACVASFEEFHNLNDTQRGNLATLVGCVLLGITHPKEFIPTIEKELEISNEVAKQIAKEVNEKIFAQVKDILITTYNLDGQTNENSEDNRPSLSDIQEESFSTTPDGFEKKLQDTSSGKQKVTIPITKEEDTPNEEPPQQNTPSDPYREFPK
ncbi:MAG: hypothetical protein KAR24_02990 [Candidatus Pacebacteria bacterium]|nr:hypothetical protein [Candidatus Paceibacterota bacterium]